MKVLFISHEKKVNGASKSLLNIIDELSSRGYGIYVLTPYKDGAFYNELINRKYVKIIVMPYYLWCQAKTKISWIKNKIMWPLFRSRINMLTAKRLSGIIKREKIDIIHSNTSVINIGALIRKDINVPHIWHLREFGDLDFDMHFYEDKNKIFNFMNLYTDRFICISNAIKNHYLLLEESKKTVVYNGIAMFNTVSTKHSDKNGIINILIAGAIYIGKGQHEAVAACELLLEKGITNFELYIAGEGKIYFPINSKIADHIHILGRVENMVELRKKINIELVCSRCEAFGRVTAEAMLAGIPVIGTNAGGTPELIKDGVDGLLYEYGNAEMLSERLKFLIENQSIREAMGIAAYNKAIKLFRIERCVDEIEKVYKSVLSK